MYSAQTYQLCGCINALLVTMSLKSRQGIERFSITLDDESSYFLSDTYVCFPFAFVFSGRVLLFQ
jgi:hypothetical protein